MKICTYHQNHYEKILKRFCVVNSTQTNNRIEGLNVQIKNCECFQKNKQKKLYIEKFNFI